MKLRIVLGIISLPAILIISCQNEQSIEFDRYYSAGSLVYQSDCQNCHGVHGEGLQGLIPPLTDSVFLKNNLHALPCLLSNGLTGKITIRHREFDGQMPKTVLNPIEIAQALTYINNTFGNNLGTVTVEKVNADLAACR
jgi:mono/diheme cytochrome c family protein